MDSDRRHELETNDLKEFLDNFKDFWEKHGNKILITLIVVLGGYAAYNYYNQWKAGKLEDAQDALASATDAGTLLGVAEEHSLVHDEAMRRAGDLFLAEARNALVAGRDEDAKEPLAGAASAYTVIADKGQTPIYQITGYEGLAKVAVMQAKWDAAEANYQKVIDMAGETYLAQAERAQRGIDRLDKLKNPVAFAPDDDLTFTPDEPIEDDDPGDDAPGGDTPDPVTPGLEGLDLPGPLE